MKIIYFILLISHILSAQNYFPALQENDFNSFKILKEKEYDGNSLWGHINGGADLYLEYGFDKLLLQEVEYLGIKFRTEFYRMNDEESAFGIFSINKFRCNKTDTLTKFICVTENQIQAAVGRFYVSISNEQETSEALNLSFQLFEKILSRSEVKIFQIPEVFNQAESKIHNNNLKFVRGVLGIQNGFPQWEELFEGIQNYSFYILPVEADSGYTNFAEIKFENEEELKKFLLFVNMPLVNVGEENAIANEGQKKEIKRISVSQLLYRESDYKTKD